MRFTSNHLSTRAFSAAVPGECTQLPRASSHPLPPEQAQRREPGDSRAAIPRALQAASARRVAFACLQPRRAREVAAGARTLARRAARPTRFVCTPAEGRLACAVSQRHQRKAEPLVLEHSRRARRSREAQRFESTTGSREHAVGSGLRRGPRSTRRSKAPARVGEFVSRSLRTPLARMKIFSASTSQLSELTRKSIRSRGAR